MKTLLSRNNLVFNPPMLGGVLFLSGLPGGSGRICDRSPYGNIGTITGATWKRLPSGLWCLSFDGSDDYIDIGDNASLDISNAITMEAWGKISTAGGDYIHKKEQAYGLDTAGAGNAQRSYVYVDGGYRLGTGGTIPSTDVWHHFVATYSSSSRQLINYRDSVVDSTTTLSGLASYTITTNNNALEIGRWAAGAALWDGDLALIRLYNRALSPFEIRNHFEQEKHLFGVW